MVHVERQDSVATRRSNKKRRSDNGNKLSAVEMDKVIQQKIMETIINIWRKNRRPDTDTIYKELTKDCASNINADDIGNQIKYDIDMMIDNGLIENRPSNQGIDSFFYIKFEYTNFT